MYSEKTIYKLIDLGILNIKNIDLPRKVRYKQRKKSCTIYKIDKDCLENRRYEDYKKFIEENPDTPIVEIDTVIGKKGGKVLLTVHFVNCSFMLAFIREHNDAQSVIDIFNDLQEKLGIEKFKELFIVILTDNGSEFSNPTEIEFDMKTGEKRTQIFYCHPSSPYEKGSCEVNHELLRRILPKGTSFNDLNQEIVKTFKETVKKLEEDRVGIVIFNTSAIVLSPLTDDYDYILKGTTIGYDEYGMSLIGDGLASCVNTFANTDRNNKELMSEDRTRIIIFSTDNQLSGYPIFTLKEAAEFAKSKKIKVYGIATSSIRPIHKQEFQEAMQITNGKLYENAKETVSSIIQEITSTNKSILKTEKETIQTDIPQQAFLILIMGFSIYVIFSRMVRK